MGDLLRAMEGPTSPAEIPANWRHLPFFSERFQAIEAQVTADPREILPPSNQRFAALEACAPKNVRVVILGQDPYHPAIAHVMPTRTELGTRTIFNILGPLTNPAGAKRQLTGAFTRDLIRPMAETLGRLGSEKAWLVHGSDGTDELTITGVSWVSALEMNGSVKDFELHPEEAGLPVHPFEAIVGGTPEDNATAFRALLAGEASAYRDAVLLNAASALLVADAVGDLKEGVAKAAESIDSGAAKSKVEALARITSEAA